VGGHSAHTAFVGEHLDGKGGWKCSQKVSAVIPFSLTDLSEFRVVSGSFMISCIMKRSFRVLGCK
jgi:hypothetical protein